MEATQRADAERVGDPGAVQRVRHERLADHREAGEHGQDGDGRTVQAVGPEVGQQPDEQPEERHVAEREGDVGQPAEPGRGQVVPLRGHGVRQEGDEQGVDGVRHPSRRARRDQRGAAPRERIPTTVSTAAMPTAKNG